MTQWWYYFSFLNKEQASKYDVLFSPILCSVSCSNQFINELGSCVNANVIVSQTHKQGATVKNKQILFKYTRIFRNFCKCIKWTVFINVYFLGRSQEAGMLPQFCSLGSGAPQLYPWCGTNCDLSIPDRRNFELCEILSSENSHRESTSIAVPSAFTAYCRKKL